MTRARLNWISIHAPGEIVSRGCDLNLERSLTPHVTTLCASNGFLIDGNQLLARTVVVAVGYSGDIVVVATDVETSDSEGSVEFDDGLGGNGASGDGKSVAVELRGGEYVVVLTVVALVRDVVVVDAIVVLTMIPDGALESRAVCKTAKMIISMATTPATPAATTTPGRSCHGRESGRSSPSSPLVTAQDHRALSRLPDCRAQPRPGP
jgi:hypothetical protein